MLLNEVDLRDNTFIICIILQFITYTVYAALVSLPMHTALPKTITLIGQFTRAINCPIRRAILKSQVVILQTAQS